MKMSQPGRTCQRRDHIHAVYIDSALKVESAIGRDRAIAFLLNEGVSPEVVDRIFRAPQRRRASDGRMAPYLRRMLCLPDEPTA